MVDSEVVERTYLRYVSRQFGEDEDDDYWVWKYIMKQIREDPDYSWRLIVNAITMAPSPKIAWRIGASTLEEFLVAHGEAYIERIVTQANVSIMFRHALYAVNPSGTSRTVQESVEKWQLEPER